ncbi:protein phosphatase 2C domain-containing protein [Streptomyces sp. NPDC018693]|uniref:protein phosphatase 2C domain-containing protein n=1 Tax=unclassified Streptomyces TaxID=2593676 RepID=UPI0037AAA927
MSQQGGRPTGHEDDWWGQLYDDSTQDTGPTAAVDSLDDRFASVVGAVGAERADGAEGEERGGGDAGVAGGEKGARSWSAASAEWVAAWDPWEPEDAEPSTDVPAHGVGPESRPPDRPRAPWEAPPETPQGPTTFPPGPLPPGFAERPPPGPHGATAWSPGVGEAPGTGTGPGSGTPQRGPRTDRPAPDPTPTPEGTVPPARTSPDATPSRRGDTLDGSPPRPGDLPAATVGERSRMPVLRDYVGSGPPTYEAEPTALPLAEPDDLADLVADTVLDGARYGVCTLRAVSVRGDSARYRGEPRRDSLLTARFGSGEHALVLVAMATGARATAGAHRAAAEACGWIAQAVGRSHARLAEDIRAARRGDLKSGLHRLTDRSLGRLRAGAAEQGLEPEEYTATLRCLLLPADPECRTRVFFGVGAGGLFRLRDGVWQDIEPVLGDDAREQADGYAEPPHAPFRFRASVARPGDTLLMCTGGLAEPLRGEPELSEYLTGRWSAPAPPGLAAFLADTQVRVKGYSDDRTAAAVWEA